MNPLNYSRISFPLLGIDVNPIRYFTVGPLTIHIYGVIIAVGMLLAVAYGCKYAHRAGLTADDITDGVLWIAPLAIVCARIYYCIFSWSSYKDNLLSLLYIWEGGIAVYGSVLGAVLGVVIFCKLKKCSLPALLDLVAVCFLIGQLIGRWGNFFNREAFGAATEAVTKMGLFNTVTQKWEYYHPTFLYESLWNLVGFCLLHFLYPKRRYDGQIALGYVAWYGLGRCMIEGLRVDSLYLGAFRVSQLLAGVSCVIAVTVLLFQSRKPHSREALAEFQTHAAPLAEKASEKPAEEAPKESTDS